MQGRLTQVFPPWAIDHRDLAHPNVIRIPLLSSWLDLESIRLTNCIGRNRKSQNHVVFVNDQCANLTFIQHHSPVLLDILLPNQQRHFPRIGLTREHQVQYFSLSILRKLTPLARLLIAQVVHL